VAELAFLRFIGVVRDLIGDGEDRCFATVFLGSGLLFIAMLSPPARSQGAGDGCGWTYRRRTGGPGAPVSSTLLTASRDANGRGVRHLHDGHAHSCLGSTTLPHDAWPTTRFVLLLAWAGRTGSNSHSRP
jgi:hypothetical protein